MDLKQTGANYDQIAVWWTEQMRGSDYGMDYVRRAMDLAKEKCRVLDIGCGSTGRVIDEARRRGFEITSLDLSSEMIRIAREKHPDALFIQTDFAEWQADRKYDLIIAWDSVFHAPIDQQEAITKKMCGLLEDEGLSCSSPPAPTMGRPAGRCRDACLSMGLLATRNTCGSWMRWAAGSY